MAIAFKKAVKAESKLRMALAGPSGAGKTFTALTLATALANGAPVAVIDTERGSASKYADLFTFDVLELDAFHPDRYVEALVAAQEAGYGVVVIDSLSHAWNGKGGLLEIVEGIAKRSYQGNTFRAWADATPIQNRLIDAITSSRLHVIATMRSKTEYVVESNDRGKSAPRKVGTAAVQRDGMEYEFDIYGQMTVENELIIEKSRCPALSGQVIRKPGGEVAQTLREWLHGVAAVDLETLTAPSAPSPTPTTTPEWDAAKDADVVKGLRALRFTRNSEQYDYLTSLRAHFDEEQRAWTKDNLMAHLREQWKQQVEAEKRAAAAPSLEGVEMGAPGN